MIDVYGISESGKKVKVGQVNESQVLNPVGGKIFYIDDTADGAYTFYDSNGNTVSAPSLGDDYTGYYYTVDGASKDKYYILNEDTVFGYGRTGTLAEPYFCYTYLDEANQSWIDSTKYTSGGANDHTYLGNLGRVYENFTFEYSGAYTGNITSQSILAYEGKRITDAIMGIQRNVNVDGVTTNTNAYIQGPTIKLRGYEEYAETIWYVLKQFNEGKYGLYANNTGCDDWYIPCFQELESINYYFVNYGGGAQASNDFFTHGETLSNVYTFSCTPYNSNTMSSRVSRAFWLRAANIAYNANRDGSVSGFQLVLIRSF